MKRLITILHTVFLISISFGQSISVSKDTLKYLFDPHTPYKDSDSLFIYNNGDNVLSIDTMINFNYTFNYLMEFCYKDSIEIGYVGYYLEMSPDMNIFPLNIQPTDSAKIIFHYIPPLSKRSVFDGLEKDSLLVYNNSTNKPIVKINILNDMPLNIDDDKTVPTEFELRQNYPNPFNPVTKIVFILPKASFISLEVFDALGRSIRKLLDNYMNVGIHEIIFDGTTFSSGVYYYQLKVGNNVFTKKMLLIK